jgi:hypothetical protein
VAEPVTVIRRFSLSYCCVKLPVLSARAIMFPLQS